MGAASSSSSPVPSPSRSAVALGWLVLVFGVLLTVSASRVIGPAFDEEKRIHAAERATDVARAVTNGGLSAIASTGSRRVFDELVPFGVLPGLLSGWLGEVFSHAGLVDRLTGARLGWLLWTGVAPAALYWIVEASRGQRAAALSACALFAMPRWVYGAAVAREPVLVASIWLAVIATYVRSLPPARAMPRSASHFRWFGPLFAGVLGLGIATDLSVLWVVPLIVLHYWGTRGRDAWRAARRGRAPLPTSFLWAIVLTPPVLVLFAPELWHGAAAAAEWLFAPLAPTIEPVLYRGAPVVALRDVPASYATNWLLATMPVGLLLLALGGVVVFVADALAVRRGAREPDPRRLGLLCLLVVGAVVVGPRFTPAVFTRFPPRAEIALPFFAVLAGAALDRLASKVVGAKWTAWTAFAVSIVLVLSGLFALPTASASFGLLAGGTRGAVASRVWSVGDGSEVAALAPALDRLGAARLIVDTRDVPRSYWALLNQLGRLRTRIDPGRGPRGSLLLDRGPHDGAISTVARGGAVLWSLVRR